MTRPDVLRRTGTPTRVGDLLLPTILTLAGRDSAGVEHFLALFPVHRPHTPSPTQAVNP
jgi:hypothetical protein